MRWEGLFADLEGQLAAEERRELDAEVAERTRRERALVDLTARFAASVGAPIVVVLRGGRRVAGEVLDLGDGWVLLGHDGRDHLVPTAAVVTVEGLRDGAEASRTARRFGLGYALRALARDRATVELDLDGGPPLVRTVDVVGADHLVLAEHPAGEPRRRENVRRTVLVAVAALRLVAAQR